MFCIRLSSVIQQFVHRRLPSLSSQRSKQPVLVQQEGVHVDQACRTLLAAMDLQANGKLTSTSGSEYLGSVQVELYCT